MVEGRAFRIRTLFSSPPLGLAILLLVASCATPANDDTDATPPDGSVAGGSGTTGGRGGGASVGSGGAGGSMAGSSGPGGSSGSGVGGIAGGAGRGGAAGAAGMSGGGGQGDAAGTGGTSGTGGSGGTSGASGSGASGRGGAGGRGGGSGAGAGTSGGRGGAGGSSGTGGTGSGATGGIGTAGAGGTSGLPGFRVQGRHLYDRCGAKVVLRGVNEMVVWTAGSDGDPEFAEIARTGANAVRIVWTVADGGAAELDRAIANALAQQLIPIPELHDATGNRSRIAAMVDYWVRSDVVAVVRKHERNLIVNIANEAGDGNVTAAQFQADYQSAVSRMRGAGYHVPLMLDAPQWGQNIDVLQTAGPALITADPDHNLLLSVHMWWNDPNGTRVMNEINQSVSANLPLVVGEFAHHAVSNCAQEPFAYRTLLSVAQAMEVSWLAWSWGGVKNSDCANDGPFDMSSDGTFAGLTGWGREVAITDTNSIQRTSVRPRSITGGTCN